MVRQLLFIAISFLFFVAVRAQEESIDVEAIIETEPYQEGFNRYKAIAVNKSAFDLNVRYRFSVIYSDQGNPPPREDRERLVVLPVVEKVDLDEHIVEISDDERKIVLLLIYDLEGKVISNARVVLNDEGADKVRDLRDKENNLSGEKVVTSTMETAKKEEDLRFEKEDGLVLRGLVFEETKTKLGRDFYQGFSYKYRDKNINGERIVKVREAFALGRNTKIEVFVGYDLVWQFFVRPNPDYLKEMENYAIDRVYKYFVRLRSQKQKKVY